MKLNIYDTWKTDSVIAGYTTEFDGAWGNNVAEDVPHYVALAEEYGLKVENMVRVHQKHTDNILVADHTNGGDGILREGASLAQDAIVTNEKGLMLCIVTADCAPVFLYDEETGAIGIVHSSRLGTAKIIAPKTVLKMQEKYGSRPENIRCIVGPYISQKHHEVEGKDIVVFSEHFSDAECSRFIVDADGQPLKKLPMPEQAAEMSEPVAEPMTQTVAAPAKTSETSIQTLETMTQTVAAPAEIGENASPTKYYVDMGEALRISLTRIGVKEENIVDNRICTFESRNLYSWRRDHNPKARILSYICLR